MSSASRLPVYPRLVRPAVRSLDRQECSDEGLAWASTNMTRSFWRPRGGERTPSVALSAIGLLPLEDLAAFAVENAQSNRSRRPRDIRRGDDRCRHVRHLNLHFPQSCRSPSRRRAEKLDSERVRRGGDDARQNGRLGIKLRPKRRDPGLLCHISSSVSLLAQDDFRPIRPVMNEKPRAPS